MICFIFIVIVRLSAKGTNGVMKRQGAFAFNFVLRYTYLGASVYYKRPRR
jgi:hypothetical protein